VARARAAALRIEAIEALGGCCVIEECGEMDPDVLEIDHIVPVRGRKRPSPRMVYLAVLRGETANLQVTCANCHRRKTRLEGSLQGRLVK
jgi:5-methylcytosine-specific restriction endonuclease McrA